MKASTDTLCFDRLVVLLCHERSGSTLFQDMLGARADVEVVGDILNYWAFDESNPRSFFGHRMRRAAERLTTLVPVQDEINETLDGYFAALLASASDKVLVNIKYGQIHNVSGFWHSPGYGSSFLSYLKRRNARLLHLHRRDMFAAVCSGHLAMKRGIWNARNAYTKALEPIHLAEQPLALQLADLSHNIKVWRYFCEVFCGLNITYEDIIGYINKHDDFFSRIEGYLELPPIKNYTSDLVKISPDPKLYISNYEYISHLARDYGG